MRKTERDGADNPMISNLYKVDIHVEDISEVNLKSICI